MSSSEQATLKVLAGHDAIEVSVLDASFRVVAAGAGELEAQLDPGIYELQVRVGPAQQRRLVKLEAGVLHEERSQLADPNGPTDPDAIQLAVPSAAPVDRTSTTREEHMHAAFESSSLLKGSRAPSGIVLMVRSLRNSTARLDPASVDGISLVDADERHVDADWRQGNESATAAFPVKAGGYALRIGPTFQSVWAARGWQTLVFIENTDDGPVADRAAVHMTRMRDAWQPQSDRRNIDLAVEAARWSLQQGRPRIPYQLLRLLLVTKFRNPMLGIIGAHILLLDARPNLKQLDEVIRNLSNLVPDHPDVRALRWMLENAKRNRRIRGAARDAISWPPMLLASYAAAIRRDADQPGAIAPGSSAERVAAQLVVTGIWTSWRQLEGEREPDPAEARVLDYVDALAARRGAPRATVLAGLDERQCALASGLPTAVVRRTLARLRESST